MKKIQALMMIAICVMMAGCSKSDGLKDLFGVVPADADMVVSVNLKSLANKADLKKGEITPELQKAIAAMGNDGKVVAPLLNGEAGIDYTSAVLFKVNKKTWFVCQLKDAEAAKSYLTKNKLTDNCIVKDDLLWSSDSRINPSDVDGYMSLSDKENFLAKDYSEKMLESDKDINFYCDLDRMINNSDVPVQEVMQMRMMMASMFNDPKYLCGNIDFEKGKIEGKFRVLTSELKPSKPAIKMGKIDENIIKAIPGDVDIVYGAALSKSAVQKIVGQYGEMLKKAGVGDILSSFKGTMLMGLSIDKNSNSNGMAFILEMDNNKSALQTASIWQGLMGPRAQVEVNDNLLVISSNLTYGKPANLFVELLEDKACGLAWNIRGYNSRLNLRSLQGWNYLEFVSDGDSDSEMELTVMSGEKEENSFKTFIKSLSEIEKDK